MANFKFQGKDYKYFTASYNDTRHNERAVEIPIVLDLIERYKGGGILEIGDVLNNYIRITHEVLDKYEKRKGTIKMDIVDFHPEENYDLIVSISTFEHIGWDTKENRDPNKILQTIDQTRWLLKEGGTMLVTVPLGYNDDLDNLFKEHKVPFDKVSVMKRDDYNGWDEITLDEALEMDYSREPCYTGIVVYKDGTEVSNVTVYTRFLVVGTIYGRPPRKAHKAAFSTSMDAGAI